MELAQLLLIPRNATHRQYEALRAYLVDRLPGPEVARRFGYTYGTLQQLVHQFRCEPDRQFFVDPQRPGVKTDDVIRQRIIHLRKQNQSVYDISEALKKEGIPRTPAAVSEVLRKEGFAKLPRRGDAERPPGTKPTAADRADVRALSLEPRTIRTKFGGLFLFLPLLAEIGFDRVIQRCGFPGTQMVPASYALRSLLALKLFGTQRHLHVMSAVLDEGLALFAGLNVVPKRSFLTEYSCRIEPACYPKLMKEVVRCARRPGAEAWRIVRPGLSHHPVPWRRRSRREALCLQKKPSAEGHPRVSGPGWRATILLLCQQRSPQGPTG